jgi:hypothetical protein
MFWPKGKCLAYNTINLLKLSTNLFNLFHNASNTIWIAPSFNCRYPSMRVHTSHRRYGYPSLTLCSLQCMHMNPWCTSRHLCCHCAKCWFPHGAKTITCASFKHVQPFSLTSQHCVQQKWHSHFNWHCHCRPITSWFTSSILCHLRICCFWCDSSQRIKLSQSTPYWSIPPLNSGGIWMSA